MEVVTDEWDSASDRCWVVCCSDPLSTTDQIRGHLHLAGLNLNHPKHTIRHTDIHTNLSDSVWALYLFTCRKAWSLPLPLAIIETYGEFCVLHMCCLYSSFLLGFWIAASVFPVWGILHYTTTCYLYLQNTVFTVWRQMYMKKAESVSKVSLDCGSKPTQNWFCYRIFLLFLFFYSCKQ